MAEAATGRYATTRYVKTEVKEKHTPVPKGMDAIMGTIQWTSLYVVNANQNSPLEIGERVTSNVRGHNTYWNKHRAELANDKSGMVLETTNM